MEGVVFGGTESMRELSPKKRGVPLRSSSSSEVARFPASSSLMFTTSPNGTGIKAWNKPRRPSLISFPLYEDDLTADKTLPPFPKPVKTN